MEIDMVVVVGAYCFRGGGGGGTICGTTEPVEALGGYLGCTLGQATSVLSSQLLENKLAGYDAKK